MTHNHQLGQNRSLSTAEFFKPADNIEVITRSYGEKTPAFNNSSALGRQLNRRVEIRVQGVPFNSTLQVFLARPGVDLTKLSEATGLLESDIKTWNGLQETDLQPYQPVRLPIDIDYNSIKHLVYKPGAYMSVSEKPNYHIVKYGENLFRLAKKYETTVNALEELNNITASDLRAGQQIRVR